jgi:D-glycero-alpha-D-manno-heptose-7-phosphate kinase
VIMSRTPVRMSFAGGGSDIPSYFQEYGGAVVSSSIDKYVHVLVNPKFDNAIRVSYSRTENVERLEDVEHELVRECLRDFGIAGGIEIATVADIPSQGTGLGSSSAFTVGLLNALAAYTSRFQSAEELAARACRIEIDVCGAPIGWQDQFAVSYGGFNLFEFLPNGAVQTSPIVCSSETLEDIQESLMMFYTGIQRSASKVLVSQQRGMSESSVKRDAMKEMVQLAYSLSDDLQANRPHSFGSILHQNWLLKRSLDPKISSTEIDAWYASARSAGAIGGKLLGAGNGGFMLFSVEPGAQKSVEESLPGLRKVPVRFETSGSKIMYYNLRKGNV